MHALLPLFAIGLLTGCADEPEKNTQNEDNGPSYPDIDFYDLSAAIPLVSGRLT